MPKLELPAPGPHMLDKLASGARHKVICAGRRWRKSTLGMLAAICGHGPKINGRPQWIGALQGGNIWWVTESFPVAESVWLAVSGILRPIAKHVSEKHYRVTLHNGGALTIKSAANPSSLKGETRGLDGAVLDEAAYHSPKVWTKNIRPALSDRKAWSLWASTPDGYNHFKEIYDMACKKADWSAWQEPSTANPFFDESEIEAARAENVPETEIQQEFFAQFQLSGAARAYHEFDRSTHVQEQDLDTSIPLDLCISFEMAPPAWLVAQGDADHGPERAIAEVRPATGNVAVRDYLALFRQMFPSHANGRNVRVYGELGRASSRSDFELVRAGLPNARVFVRSSPFDEKDRVNAVNLTLRDSYGLVGGFVDPGCQRLITDLEATRNSDASFRINREVGLGFYAAAWGAKLAYVYPALLETLRSRKALTRWPEASQEQRRAWRAVEKAKKDGRLVVPPSCQDCGATRVKLEAAHLKPGYLPENDLLVRFLCHRCHTRLDSGASKRVA